MSHFAVAVFTETGGKTIEELLAPYDENKEVDRYVKYTKEQLIEKGRKEIEDYCNGTYAEFLKNPESYKAGSTNQNHINYLENEFPKRLQWSDEQVYQEEIRFYEKENIGPDGEVYSEYNPLSKWDWWTKGGRWQGLLLIKTESNGTSGKPAFMTRPHESENPAPDGYKWVDSAKLKDICWDKMAEIERQAHEKYWDEAQGKDDFKKQIIYGIRNGMTKEEYLKDSGFGTFAVVTPDGKWHEKGKMGWWACVSDEKEGWAESYFDTFIKNADQELTITIVDCHI